MMQKIRTLSRPAVVRKIMIFLIIKIIIVIAALYGTLFVFVNAKGKDLLLDSIKRKYGVEAQLDALVLQFPLRLEMINFSCGDMSFRKASASLSLTKPADFPLSLNNVCVDELFLRLTRSADGWTINPFLSKPSPEASKEIKEAEADDLTGAIAEKKNMPFTIKKLHCRNAVVELVYNFKKTTVINFDNVNLKITNFVYPQLPKFSLDLVTSLRSPLRDRDMPEMITASGWIDYFHKNMDVALKVNNFDYIAYSDYYPEVWKPKNLRVNEAVLSLDSVLRSQDNDLLIDALFSLEKIEFLETSDEGSGARVKIIKETIAHFKKGDEKPQYHFITRTAMDSPEQFLPALLEDLRGSVPIGPALIAEIAIEKTKESITKGAEQAVDKTKETISKGVEGVKKFTVDAALETINSTVGAVKDIVVPSKEQRPEPEKEAQQ